MKRKGLVKMHLSVVIVSYRRWVWSFAVLAFFTMPVVASPSFDCRSASKPDEQAICGSAELSALESTMSEKFIAARATGDANKIRDLARDLLKQRRDCKADVACDILSKGIASFDSQQPRQDQETPAQIKKRSTFAFELKEETPTERCDVAECNKDCVKYYGSPGVTGDYGPLPIAVCQSFCVDQKPFCLAHDGVAIQVPDIAPSSMGKLEILFCAKNKGASVCKGEQ
jgi:hypothetical protein